MKKQKVLFNFLLLKYNKYRAKLNRFQLTGRNIHRQGVLKKHIERLHTKLYDLYNSINLKKVTGIAMLSASMMITPNADAQITFAGAPSFETNPFSLTDIGNDSSPTYVDIDNDGDLDLFSGDYFGDFSYFANTGTATAPVFAAVQNNPFSLTNIGYGSSPTFIDIDNDGDLDLFSGENIGNFLYFENTGTASVPSYAAVQNNPFALTDIGAYSKPSFADIDNDGDFDLIAGNNYGDFEYFENTGTATSPMFAAAQTNPFSLTTSSSNSAPTFADIDNDGDLDLFAGEIYGNFYYFENIGSAVAPTYAAVQTNPFSLFRTGSLSTPTFADIDNDGDLDLITGENYGKFSYFENFGTVSSPDFQNPNATQINPFSLTYIGSSESHPTFADLDNDGDLDLLAGKSNGEFYYFQNTGTVSAPAFATVQTNPFSLSDIGNYSRPILKDIDNDGDFDLFAGEGSGSFYYFENIGSATSPTFAAVQTNPFSLTNIVGVSYPTFVDLDNDGDFDLFTGEFGGNFYYFENTGTAIVPVFATAQTNPFSLTDIGIHSTPTFIDIDNDGDFDLLSGDYYGNFTYFENTGTAAAPMFTTALTNPFSLTGIGYFSIPSLVDIDNDGDFDLFSGESDGDIYFMKNITTPSAVIEWAGTTDTDWATATNWQGGVAPTSADVVNIPDVSGASGNFPIISSATTVADVTIDANANLTVNTGITLDGTFTNNGTVTLKDGAYLDDFTNASASFVGDVSVERLVSNGAGNDQRFISSAVNTPNVSEIGDDLNGPLGAGLLGTNNVAVTVDNCATPTLTSSSNYGNLFEFNESLVASCAMDGWVVRSSGSLENGRGYSAYLTNGSTFELSGTPNTGNISVPVTKGTSGVADGQGWNLIGNPYPSPISRDAVVAAGGANASYFVTSGVYQGTYTAYGIGSNIAVGQGFQVEVAATGNVVFTNAMRNTNAATWYQNDAWFTHKLEIAVLGAQFADKTTLFFNNEATNGYEPMYDVTKRTSKNGQPTLSTTGAGKNLTLNGLSVNDLGETVPMNLLSGANGNFTLSFEGLETFGNTTIYVKDLQENLVHNIENGDYNFTASTSDNEERFELIFIPEVAFSTTKVDCEGNAGSIQLANNNMINDRSFTLTGSDFTTNDDLVNLNQNLEAGNYTLNIADQFGGTQVYNVAIETAEVIEADFTVSNVEVQVGEVISLENTTTNSENAIWNFGEGTEINNISNPTYVYQEAGVYEISLQVSSEECADEKVATITVSNKTTGISVLENEAITVHPNPVKNILIVDYIGDIEVEIVNVLGEKVLKTTSNKIDMQNVTNGVYFVYIYDTAKTLLSVNKIVKK